MSKTVILTGRLVGTGKSQVKEEAVEAPVVEVVQEDVFVQDTIAMIRKARRKNEINNLINSLFERGR